ncbi:MAG: cupin domain-containing protein [Candidatus Competibacter sp.]
MSKIRVDKNPDAGRLRALDVESWPIWTKEVSEFPWEYDAEETCYVLEGRVTVTPEGGQPVEIGPGDLATFPKGMRCTWRVDAPIRKHYSFS